MSLKHIAQTVQAQGRGDDTVLIHMTPKEVQGLQALAMSQGGSLTVNPATGLPEAGFLSSILPTLIGAGLSVASGGTLSPLMAGLLVGGGTGLITGDMRKGLMAGLGGYGGAGLGAGLVGAGANAAQTAAQAGLPAASQGAVGQGLQAAIPSATANSMFGGVGLQAGATQGLQAAAGQGLQLAQALPTMATDIVAPGAANMAAATATEAYQALPWYEQMGQGVTAAFKNPTAAIEAMGGGKNAMQYGMAAAAPAVLDAMTPATSPMASDSERYLYQYDRPMRSTDDYEGPYSGERQYFGDGTLTRLAAGGTPEAHFQMTGASKDAFDYLMGRTPVSPRMQRASPAAPVLSTPTAPAQGIAAAAQGADDVFNFNPATGQLTALRRPAAVPDPALANDAYAGRGSDGYAGGGAVAGLARGGFVVPADVVSMLGEGSTDAGLRALRNKYGPAVAPIRGPGTGQSDSIKTSVEGRRPARVADGEAYIPPQVVAKHGGAKKLYAVLDRVRAASQGHTQQQRRVNPGKVLA